MDLDDAYQRALKRKEWQRDDAQQAAITAIAPIVAHWQLGYWRRLLRRQSLQWLYLWGPSGTGKTKLMDLVVACLPKSQALRTHFIPFMSRIEADLLALGKRRSACEAALKRLQQSGIRFICLDEFYVDNITDAMVMGRLLEAAEKHGVRFFFTSNSAPSELYPNGLQRDRFLSTIARINTNAFVYHLATATDYRDRFALSTQLQALHALPPQHLSQALHKFFADCQNGLLCLNGRSVRYLGKNATSIWFCFADICQTPRHSADYRELSTQFSCIIITQAPRLNAELSGAARRFISLIDVLYDAQVITLVFGTELYMRWHDLYQDTPLQRPFMRTASRLQEMHSAAYIANRAYQIKALYNMTRCQ